LTLKNGMQSLVDGETVAVIRRQVDLLPNRLTIRDPGFSWPITGSPTWSRAGLAGSGVGMERRTTSLVAQEWAAVREETVDAYMSTWVLGKN